MQISAIQSYNYNQKHAYNPYFGINLNSKKLNFKYDDFFVRIHGYGKNTDWAKIIKETADNAVTFIRENCNFEITLQKITQGVTKANQIPLDLSKRKHTGILRINREGWICDGDWNGFDLITRYGEHGNKRYKSYASKLDEIVKQPLSKPYKDISLSRPIHSKNDGKYLCHGDASSINNAFKHIENIYNNIYSKYIKNEAKPENIDDINSNIAEIRWILAHSTPWERGSDAISNVFIRALYKAIGVKTTPLKKGISLDLEAYCTELKDYKKNFASYFTHKPYVVE